MVQNHQEMTLRKGVSIFKISVFAILVCSCTIENDCFYFKAEDFAQQILSERQCALDSAVLISEYMNINELYSVDIEKIRDNGFYKLDCQMSKIRNIQSISIKEMTPGIFDELLVIELSVPYYNSTSKRIAILSTVYCGNDCGSIDLYFLTEAERGWKIDNVVNLGQM
jgi:hypothetical protein